MSVFPVEDYRPRGSDLTAALEGALAAAHSSGGGVIGLPSGLWTISAADVLVDNDPTISILGCGSGSTILQPTKAVAGDVFRIQCEIGASYVGTQAGKFGGFTIDGSNASAGAVGWHYGDTAAGEFDDLVVQNFFASGSRGVKMHNAKYWTERTVMRRVWLNNNFVGIEFEDTAPGTGSFGYSHIYGVEMNVNAGQTGWLMTSGQLYGCPQLDISGNIAAKNVAFIHLNTGGGGAFNHNHLEIQAEGPGVGLLIEKNDNLQSCWGGADLATGGMTNVDHNGFSTFSEHWNVPGVTVKPDPHFVNG